MRVFLEGLIIGEGVLLLPQALGSVGGGERVWRSFSGETALEGAATRSFPAKGTGLGKRQWLDEELRVAATAHSIMLQCQFCPHHRTYSQQYPNRNDRNQARGHLSESARLYFTGSLKLLKPLNYDWVMAIMNIYQGTTPSVYILSITVSLAEEGGTTTCLNSCLFNLEQSEPAMLEIIVMSDSLNALMRRISPSSCCFSLRFGPSQMALPTM